MKLSTVVAGLLAFGALATAGIAGAADSTTPRLKIGPPVVKAQAGKMTLTATCLGEARCQAVLTARIDVPMVAAGQSVRALVHGAKPASAADAPRVAAELVASQFDTVAAAAEGCDALVATGLMPAGQRSIAEVLGIHYVCVTFTPRVLPSPHHSPPPSTGQAKQAFAEASTTRRAGTRSLRSK